MICSANYNLCQLSAELLFISILFIMGFFPFSMPGIWLGGRNCEFYLVSCRIYLYSVNLPELYCWVRLSYLVNSTGSCFYDLLGSVLQCSCRADYSPPMRKDASVYSSHYPMNLEFSLFCPVGTITAPRLVWVPKTVPSNPPSWLFPWPGVISTNICRLYSPEHLKEILCSSLCSLCVLLSVLVLRDGV